MQGLIPHYCIDYCNYVLSGQFQAILYPIRTVLNAFVMYIMWCWRKVVVHVFYLVSCSYSKAVLWQESWHYSYSLFHWWLYMKLSSCAACQKYSYKCVSAVNSVQFYIQMENRPSLLLAHSFVMGFIHWIFIHFSCNRIHEIVTSLKSTAAVGKGFLLEHLHMLINSI